MAVTFLPDRQYGAPAAADGVSVPVNDGFHELIAATDADWVLTGMVARPLGTIFDSYRFEVEIGVGDEGDEEVIATFGGYLQEVFGSVGSECLHWPTVIGIDAIPSGSRVSVHWSATGTDNSMRFSLSHLKKPIVGTLLTTANPLKFVPVTVLTEVVAWDTSVPPVEAWDTSGPSRAIVGLLGKIDWAGTEWELDVCTGAGDDVKTTVRGTCNGVSSFPNLISLPHPLVVPAATRVRLQCRCKETSEISMFAGVQYFDLPL